MGWLSELSTVYDRIAENKKIDNENKPLPLYHIANNASLVITLNGKGEFQSAELIKKAKGDDRQTCMPCTEEAAGRTSGIAPFPFCDKIEYVAGDYGEKGKKEEKYQAYLSLLGGWAESEYSNAKIKSVHTYVKNGTLIQDILKKRAIPDLDTPEKIAEATSGGFVRWKVEIPGETENRTWMDPEIQRLWIAYYSKHFSAKQGLCYVSGKIETIAGSHPKKIRNSGDGAKLISSNDAFNYTFRGRFADADQACQIGAEVSLKAHNALRWLIERQGATVGSDLTIVAWCAASDVQPQVLQSSHDLFSDEREEEDAYYGAEASAKIIANRLRGYYGKIKDNDKILVMGLNAASPGRMSLLLYREFNKTDFCEAQEHWHTHLEWFYSYWPKGEKHSHQTLSAPAPEEIAKAAYGAHISDSVKIMVIERLLPCILDKAPIPADIERRCFSQASNLITIDGSFDREKTLETACAVIKYNLHTKNKEEYAVGLEKDRTDRDYLYGRLLAVADRIESMVLKERDEKRETNAVRYMQRFVKYPCSTWELLYADKLRPYSKHLKQMHPGSHKWYEDIIQDISSKFDAKEFTSDKALSGLFLLGYHCQQKDFWHKQEKEVSINENEEDSDGSIGQEN